MILIKASKALGQNFLIDEFTVNSIVKKSEISKNDLVIEIGPGLGTLTSKLLENAGKVVAIELDKKVLEILNDRFCLYDNFELINQDVLKVDLNNLIKNNTNESITSCKVVANLPYYITTPIIMKLLQDKLPLVSRNCFIPAPEVDSAVINLKLLKEPRVKVTDEKLFFDVIKAAFSQKRKTLINGLVNNKIISSKEEAERLLSSLGLNPQIRGEKLSIQDFANLANFLNI